MAADYRKKLIEVALPLEAINRESAREKSIRHGHPSTLHLWWARRPLAACRAVLFASIVDDPSSRPEEFPTEETQDAERQRLFGIIEDLVKWDNSTNETVLERARAEIRKATNGRPPAVLDPFCGGGSIPLEAQRLGMEAHASDLNPVAVLITKALIEIPPKFFGRPPVNPEDRKRGMGVAWRAAAALAADVRYYGSWMRDEAERRIGHLYPKVDLPPEYGGGQATVIAWLWARTVKCPNPACGATMPLVRSFALSTKPGKKAWIEPVVDRASRTVGFHVRRGDGLLPESPKVGRGAIFRCLVCGHVAEESHIKAEGRARGMGIQLMAIVAEGRRGRVYLAPDDEQTRAAAVEPPAGLEEELPDNPRWFSPPVYGLTRYRDLFTPRQLVALTTFSDLIAEARQRILEDSASVGLPIGVALASSGTEASDYADAVTTYLAFGLSKASSRNCELAIWETGMDRLAGALSRQALPMTWDFAETNPLAGAGGDIAGTVASVAEVLEKLPTAASAGVAHQADATASHHGVYAVATDPPYYDNVGYADLSDFFYVWLRRSLAGTYPDLFGTLLTPKATELIASPYRFEGSRERAKAFFEQGLGVSFTRMREAQDPKFPLTVFYAFKQAESEPGSESNGNEPGLAASTGWETMLEGLLSAGCSVTGTWPIRSELTGALKKNVNALASSIVLVCRPRPADAPRITHRDLRTALRAELPHALKRLQQERIAPVDFDQAAIGPGMAIFSRYSQVIEPDGSRMRVRTALQLISQEADAALRQQEGELDPSTRWAVSWFEQRGMQQGPYGEAEVLSKSRNVDLNQLQQAGILTARGGKVQLVAREDLDPNWEPGHDHHRTDWRLLQQLIRSYDDSAGGVQGAGDLLSEARSRADAVRDLAYRLYAICNDPRKGWSAEAQAYNRLAEAWPDIVQAASHQGPAQTSF